MTTETPDKTFVGLPISGDVNYYTTKQSVPQKTAAEFKEALDKVFAAGAHAVVWTQYTPYFNDGEACEFDVNEPGVVVSAELFPLLAGVGSDEEYYDEQAGEDVPVYTSWSLRDKPELAAFNTALGELNGTGYFRRSDDDPALLGMGSGAYDDVLHEAFGDPARVIAKPSGFTVEHYDHD